MASSAAQAYFSMRFHVFKSHHTGQYKVNAADPWEHARIQALGEKPVPARRAFMDEFRERTGGSHKDAAAAWEELPAEQKKKRQSDRDMELNKYTQREAQWMYDTLRKHAKRPRAEPQAAAARAPAAAPSDGGKKAKKDEQPANDESKKKKKQSKK